MARANVDLRDAYRAALFNLAPTLPTTCPEGGTRRARNRDSVRVLAALGQEIGSRKAPTYCRWHEGGSAKLVCLSLGSFAPSFYLIFVLRA